jgi:hypothetical protein
MTHSATSGPQDCMHVHSALAAAVGILFPGPLVPLVALISFISLVALILYEMSRVVEGHAVYGPCGAASFKFKVTCRSA